MLKSKIALIFLISTPFLLASVQDQDPTKMSIFDLIDQKSMPQATLKTDFSGLIENKMNTAEYYQGIFSFSDEAGKKNEFPVKVKVRGKFRRKKCEFPPLKLKFKKAHLLSSGLDTFNKMKLVTHCLDDLSKDASNLEKEFLAYKIYNELSENSFRVQMVKMKYVDAAGKRKPVKSFAFLIEEDEQVAERLGGTLCDCINRPKADFDTKQIAKTALFNYMIGNPDYDFRTTKNLKMVKHPDGKITAVPYDFDFSAFVYPPYLNFEKMKGAERTYKGFNLTAEEETEIKDFFYSKKDIILEMISKYKHSSRKEKIDMRRYVKDFYEQLMHLNLSAAAAVQPKGVIPQTMSK